MNFQSGILFSFVYQHGMHDKIIEILLHGAVRGFGRATGD